MSKCFFYVTVLLFSLSCTTGRTTAEQDAQTARRAIDAREGPNSVEVNAAETGLDLIGYLRRVPGLQINGSGENAIVSIRGNANFQGDVSPLFVVNGTPVGNDLSRVYGTVDVNEIKRVRVLKTVSETNRYGMQGSNGVIEIVLK